MLETWTSRGRGTASETWEKVGQEDRTRMMPPAGANTTRAQWRSTRFATELESRLTGPSIQGRLVTRNLHRLNRTEYATRFAISSRSTSTLTRCAHRRLEPGFDNLAEALAVSRRSSGLRLGGGMKISRLAVGDRTLAPSQTTFAPPSGIAQDRT